VPIAIGEEPFLVLDQPLAIDRRAPRRPAAGPAAARPPAVPGLASALANPAAGEWEMEPPLPLKAAPPPEPAPNMRLRALAPLQPPPAPRPQGPAPLPHARRASPPVAAPPAGGGKRASAAPPGAAAGEGAGNGLARPVRNGTASQRPNGARACAPPAAPARNGEGVGSPPRSAPAPVPSPPPAVGRALATALPAGVVPAPPSPPAAPPPAVAKRAPAPPREARAAPAAAPPARNGANGAGPAPAAAVRALGAAPPGPGPAAAAVPSGSMGEARKPIAPLPRPSGTELLWPVAKAAISGPGSLEVAPEPTLEIEAHVDAIEVHLRRAPSWRRVVAFLVDVVVIGPFVALLLAPVLSHADLPAAWALDEIAEALSRHGGVVLPALAVAAVVTFAYQWLGIALMGATLGKYLLRLRVVGPDGRRPSFGRSALRAALSIPSTLLLGLGPLLGFFTRSGRSLHDFCAGTYPVLAP